MGYVVKSYQQSLIVFSLTLPTPSPDNTMYPPPPDLSGYLNYLLMQQHHHAPPPPPLTPAETLKSFLSAAPVSGNRPPPTPLPTPAPTPPPTAKRTIVHAVMKAPLRVTNERKISNVSDAIGPIVYKEVTDPTVPETDEYRHYALCGECDSNKLFRNLVSLFKHRQKNCHPVRPMDPKLLRAVVDTQVMVAPSVGSVATTVVDDTQTVLDLVGGVETQDVPPVPTRRSVIQSIVHFCSVDIPPLPVHAAVDTPVATDGDPATVHTGDVVVTNDVGPPCLSLSPTRDTVDATPSSQQTQDDIHAEEEMTRLVAEARVYLSSLSRDAVVDEIRTLDPTFTRRKMTKPQLIDYHIAIITGQPTEIVAGVPLLPSLPPTRDPNTYTEMMEKRKGEILTVFPTIPSHLLAIALIADLTPIPDPRADLLIPADCTLHRPATSTITAGCQTVRLVCLSPLKRTAKPRGPGRPRKSPRLH